MKPVRKAVIPIAGLGSRFLPATKCIPKEMLPIFDRPVIELIVRELAGVGVQEVIFVVPPEGSITPKHFYQNDWLESELRKKGKVKMAETINELSHMMKIATVVQQNPYGDGHAILQARDLVDDEPFFAFFGDEILDSDLSAPAQLLQARGEEDRCVLGLQKVPEKDISKFGIISPLDKGGMEDFSKTALFEIETFVEKPQPQDAPSDLALLGKNLCSPQIFSALENATAGAGGELRLVDAFLELRKSEPLYGCILSGERFDVGNPRGLLEASNHFAQK